MVTLWRRWRQVAGCALLVSAGSAWMFPRSWIYWCALHGMAVMPLDLPRHCTVGRGLWLAGALAVGLAQWAPWAHAAWGLPSACP